MMSAMMASKARPPITPPTIAPTLFVLTAFASTGVDAAIELGNEAEPEGEGKVGVKLKALGDAIVEEGSEGAVESGI